MLALFLFFFVFCFLDIYLYLFPICLLFYEIMFLFWLDALLHRKSDWLVPGLCCRKCQKSCLPARITYYEPCFVDYQSTAIAKQGIHSLLRSRSLCDHATLLPTQTLFVSTRKGYGFTNVARVALYISTDLID